MLPCSNLADSSPFDIAGEWIESSLVINYNRRYDHVLNEQESVEAAKNVFRQHGGVLRTSKVIDLGKHPRILYRMRGSGILDQLSRCVYRLSDLPPLTDPDLVTVATKIPDGVVCLISALGAADRCGRR